jgi:Fe-S cluster biosynthesis and repair protein YggX
MHDYMSVLALLHAYAADQRSRALLGKQAEIANKTTERTLRNRAMLICERLLDLPEPRRRQFAERAVRRL